MLDVGKMVDAVLEVVDKPLRAFSERLKAVEARVPEKGERGDNGEVGETGAAGTDGKDGRDGVDGKDGTPGEIGPAGPSGPQGLIGEKGDAGRDGRDAADLAMLRKDIADMIAATITDIFKAATFTSPDFCRTLQFTLAGITHEMQDRHAARWRGVARRRLSARRHRELRRLDVGGAARYADQAGNAEGCALATRGQTWPRRQGRQAW